MQNNTQLLCSFVPTDQLDSTLRQIEENYDIAFDSIYVLENVDSPGTLCCTYNIILTSPVGDNIPTATISLHRKKATNTLYTINALNMLVMELNNGTLDKEFRIPWQEYRNTILVTAYNRLKRINTKLHKIVKVSDI